MTLIELNPRTEGNALEFDCPKCKNHRVLIPLVGNKNSKRTWSMYGDFLNAELRPSISIDCCLFTVNNGEVRLAK